MRRCLASLGLAGFGLLALGQAGPMIAGSGNVAIPKVGRPCKDYAQCANVERVEAKKIPLDADVLSVSYLSTASGGGSDVPLRAVDIAPSGDPTHDIGYARMDTVFPKIDFETKTATEEALSWNRSPQTG